MRKYTIKKANFEMNLAPLIDVVFLLLIFFMVASTLNLSEVKATIQLPGTGTVEENGKGEFVLYIDRKGQIFSEEEAINWEQVSDILQQFLNQKKTNQIIVYADKEVDFQYIVNMLDVANQLKIDKMQFSLHHR